MEHSAQQKAQEEGETAALPPPPLPAPVTPRQAAALDRVPPLSAASAALSLTELWEGIGGFLSCCPLDLAAASATNATARTALAPLLGDLRRVAAAELLHVMSVAAAVQDGPTQAHLPVEQSLHALLGYATSDGWLTYLVSSSLLPSFTWVLHACPGHAPIVGLTPRGSALPWLSAIYDAGNQRLVSTGVVLLSQPTGATASGLSGELAWSAAMLQQPPLANHMSLTGCSMDMARALLGAALLLRHLSRLPAAELMQLSR